MAMGGGGSREWLAPLSPDGKRHESSPDGYEISGAHRGFYAGLNVANPKPGYVYQWVRNDPRDVFLARQRGWEIVSSEDDDMPAFKAGMISNEDSDTPTQLDTSNVFQDIVFVRIQESRHHETRERIREQNRARLSGGAQDYLDQASPAERATGRTDRGYLPTRLARSEHGLQVRQDGEVIRSEGPEGILKG